jgi:hypothetical protein
MLRKAENPSPLADTDDHGIVDWDLKWKSFEFLFGALSNREMASAILGYAPNDRAHHQDVESVSGSFKSWGNHKPTGNAGRLFVAGLTKRLQEFGCQHPNIPGIIVSGIYADYYDIIPEAHRKGLVKPLRPDHWEEQDFLKDDDEYHPLWVARNAMIETAKDGLVRGRIDQKLHYLIPDAVENWKAIIDSGQYRQYDECKASLYALTEGEEKSEWRKFVRDGNADGIVMLGTGSPTKDIILIESLLSNFPSDKIVHYAMIDFSGYMLEWSLRIVDTALRRTKNRQRVKLTPLKLDFMDLSGVDTLLRRPGKNVAWFIPGGTIGNLNERKLLRSVARHAMVGDIFVVGAETVLTDSPGSSKPALKHKYESSAIRKFVEAPLRSVWHDVGLSGDIRTVSDNITIDVVDGISNEHSTVDGAISVEVSITMNDRKIVLLTSTRYDESKLIAFAEREGFYHQTTIKSPLNLLYKQIVFGFNGRPSMTPSI